MEKRKRKRKRPTILDSPTVAPELIVTRLFCSGSCAVVWIRRSDPSYMLLVIRSARNQRYPIIAECRYSFTQLSFASSSTVHLPVLISGSKVSTHLLQQW